MSSVTGVGSPSLSSSISRRHGEHHQELLALIARLAAAHRQQNATSGDPANPSSQLAVPPMQPDTIKRSEPDSTDSNKISGVGGAGGAKAHRLNDLQLQRPPSVADPSHHSAESSSNRKTPKGWETKHSEKQPKDGNVTVSLPPALARSMGLLQPQDPDRAISTSMPIKHAKALGLAFSDGDDPATSTTTTTSN